MGHKAVSPVCCVMRVKEPRTLIVKEKGLAPVFLDSRLEHPAGWICAHYKSYHYHYYYYACFSQSRMTKWVPVRVEMVVVCDCTHCSTEYSSTELYTPQGVEKGSGEWGVGSGEWGVGSGEWGVGSGEWGVGSGEWGVGK